MTRYLEL